MQPGFASARGWRGLLPVPMVEEMPPFGLEFEPAGWAQLEAWAAAGEDARSMSHDEQAGLMEQSEWPDPPPSFGGSRGWRDALPPAGLERGFELFPSAAGPVDESHTGHSRGDSVAIPEIEGGRL